jgi:cytochrome P450
MRDRTCYLLAENPRVEAKLVEEVRTVIGEREPTADDLPRLSYTEMILKESMRLYPAVGALDVAPWRTARLVNIT